MLCHIMKKWRIFNTLDPEFMSNVHIAIVYGDLDDNALIVTNDDMVYAIGTNSNGRLGIGDTLSIFDPVEVEKLSEKGIKTFACGQNHVLALTKKGRIYSWGHKVYEPGNYYNQVIQCLTPTLLLNNLSTKCVVNICCGSNHSLALTNKGELYEWKNVTSSNFQFTQVPFSSTNRSIISIACGKGFSMVVTDDGKVYGWGENDVGQLGIGDHAGTSNPCKVAALDNIIIEKVVCGYMHTLALSAKGILYVWGENSYGQLGLGSEGINVKNPVELKAKGMKKVWDVAASYRSHISVAMGEGNKVFIWGQCLEQSIVVPTITLLTCLDEAFLYYAWPRVTYQPLIFDNGKSSNLKTSLNKAFNDPATSDLIIEVQGNSIYVHKAVLKIRCHHFRTMFQQFWKESSRDTMQLEKYSYEVYKSFLKYLYTDEIDVSSEDALVELLDIANMYFASQLKRRCVQMLVQKFTVENVIYLYSISVKYNIKELETRCFKFILSHMSAVVQTSDFIELDKNILRSVLTKAAQAGAFKT